MTPISWDRIYSCWTGLWIDAVDGIAAARPPVVTVTVPFFLSCERHEWWPTNTVDERRRRMLEEHGAGYEWRDRAGIAQTAYLLSAAVDDEGVAAAWIGAAAHQLQHRGSGMSRELMDIEHACGAVLRSKELGGWHHASTITLPATTQTPRLMTLLRAGDELAVVEIARLDALATMAHWTLVKTTSASHLRRSSLQGDAQTSGIGDHQP